MTLSDDQLDRYARHIVLHDIGGAGQARLLDSHVLLVGAGGIGCPAIQYLAAAGVGTISVVDDV
jgi:adenylyltransferase/sulfurtransferase